MQNTPGMLKMRGKFFLDCQLYSFVIVFALKCVILLVVQCSAFIPVPCVIGVWSWFLSALVNIGQPPPS
jgi:hypothetical protein